ncbi:HAD family hydrolase [Cyanobacteria bacterium FACHB-472]|nr:HAD family hydrolase [Cyanobacteria bacterium FACHB-472]
MKGTAPSVSQPPQCYQRQATSPYYPELTVFCDFDGPIVDVSRRYYTTYQLALAETQELYQAQGEILPITMLKLEQFWQMKQERVPDVEIAMRSGLAGEQIDIFLQCVVNLVNQPALLQKDKMQPGVNWALPLLHSQGFKLVLVTLRSSSQVTQILQNYGLARLFSGIYGTEDDDAAYVNYAHVKTQLLEKAIAQHSQPNSESSLAWMVGDTEADILAGQAVSIPTIALTCGIRSRQRLQQFQPTCIHNDLLSVAHYLLEVNSPRLMPNC